MNSRFHGTVCLAIGMLGLGCFLLFGDGKSRGGFAAPSSASLLKPLAEDSWQLTYWGQSTELSPSSTLRHAWTIHVIGLPRDSEGTRTVIINCVGQPLSVSDWDLNKDRERVASFIYEQMATGEIRQLFGRSDFNELSIPVDMLLIGRPAEFEQTGPYQQTLDQHPHATTLQKVACSRENGTVTYSVSSQDLALRLCLGERRAQLTFNRKQAYPSELTSSVNLLDKGVGLRTSLTLSFGHAAKLSVERSAGIENDLSQWRTYHAETMDAARLASLGSTAYSPATHLDFCNQLSELKLRAEQSQDPASRQCLKQICIDPGIALPRVQLAWEVFQDLRKNSPAIHWQSVQADGTAHSAVSSPATPASPATLKVLGFTHAGGGLASQTVETLQRIKARFSSCDVQVLVFNTDLDDLAKAKFESAVGPHFTVLEGAEIAEDLDLYRCGVPAIIIQGQDGTVHALHSYQNHASEQMIAQQLEQLLGKHADQNRLSL